MEVPLRVRKTVSATRYLSQDVLKSLLLVELRAEETFVQPGVRRTYEAHHALAVAFESCWGEFFVQVYRGGAPQHYRYQRVQAHAERLP